MTGSTKGSIVLSAGIVSGLWMAACTQTRLAGDDEPSSVSSDIVADIEALATPDPRICGPALKRLGGKHGRAAVPFLIDALKNEKERVRKWSALALGMIGDPRAVDALVASMKDNPLAAQALGRIGEPAVESLIAALKDKHWSARAGAARALGMIRTPRATGPLIAALGDELSGVWYAVGGALVEIGPSVVEPLIAALKDGDELTRRGAAWTLGRARDPRAIPALIAALKGNPVRVWGEAVSALARMPDQVLEPLVSAIESPDAMTRSGAARALGRLKIPRAVPHLIEALKDQQSEVRAGAATGLREIPDPRTVEPLIAALEDESPYVRGCAAAALGETKDARAIDPLLVALEDESSGPRCEAAMALAAIGAPRVVEPLVNAIKDEKAHVRRSVAVALGELADPRGVEPLVALLRDDEEWTEARKRAATSLGLIGDERAVPSLIAVLKDGNYWLKGAASKALVNIGEPAVPLLKPLLGHESPFVRDRAAAILAKIDSKLSGAP